MKVLSRFTENVSTVLIALAAISLIIGIFESFALGAIGAGYLENYTFYAGIVLFIILGVAGSFFAGLGRKK